MNERFGRLAAPWLCAGALAAAVGPVAASEWGYGGENGPAKWSSLKPEFGACLGRNQSPVDIAATIDAVLPPLTFAYRAAATDVVNNGHTVQVNYGPGSTVKIDGIAFELKQFHFHSPSENRVSGKAYPLEAHLVHADKDGNLAVVAVFFQEGPANPALGAVWAQMPKAPGQKNAAPPALSAAALLPANRDYWRYNGSLTTPPCTEGVRWIVMKHAGTVSKEQVAAFGATLGFANNRPVQAVNARPVLR
jgi:carbonic anhydrase